VALWTEVQGGCLAPKLFLKPVVELAVASLSCTWNQDHRAAISASADPPPPLADKLTSALRKLESEKRFCARAHATLLAAQLRNGDFDDFPQREVSRAGAWAAPQCSMVVAMPCSACHLGIGKRSNVERLCGRGGRERT